METQKLSQLLAKFYYRPVLRGGGEWGCRTTPPPPPQKKKKSWKSIFSVTILFIELYLRSKK